MAVTSHSKCRSMVAENDEELQLRGDFLWNFKWYEKYKIDEYSKDR